jgi:hypothetical protein
MFIDSQMQRSPRSASRDTVFLLAPTLLGSGVPLVRNGGRASYI